MTEDGRIIETYTSGMVVKSAQRKDKESDTKSDQLIQTSHAQVDCADWNTAAFFRVAGTSDVTRCLQAGTNPNARDKSGYTPLHFAAEVGNSEAVTALTEAGAGLEAKTKYYDATPLDLARNAEAVMALLEAGANPNGGKESRGPLHGYPATWSAEVVMALVDAGANPNARMTNGGTPLHVTASQGSSEAVRALLEAGADPNVRARSGETPLHLAASRGNAETVTALLEGGADPNVRARSGETPLHLAADNEAVRALLEVAGADAVVRDEAGGNIAAPAQARVDCAKWNTAAFFKAASESDVIRCLEVARTRTRKPTVAGPRCIGRRPTAC